MRKEELDIISQRVVGGRNHRMSRKVEKEEEYEENATVVFSKIK